ncbi:MULTISPECIES: iron-containing alcohol dehydrogenase [Gammaproteobacteria]|uniref:iron-containing alcohol dehydrogenase n=1 Tax=Gammaproteobacteria TaxID=1236 RepID=UPI001AD9B862|nr:MULTISPECIES: iron-containing alcohol dehydrogenase [Gammaproteobacteria]MBO9482379.1 iron-containing alcohol dehydrogenase [Salinisphaera sp. G21_0]MBO9495945.1 iron-containing alcohol dehydrogenase [Thalassotalea sp. G20_0]
MMNFNYQNPTHIVFGQDRLQELDQLVPANAKVLVLYGGGSVKKFGTLEKVLAGLGNREVLEFSGIEPNPKFTTLMKAVEIVRAENIDFLLAVGGGSVMDGTKFVAAAAPYEGDEVDLLKAGFAGAPITTAIPLATVATLPATGSEMNMGAVISHDIGKLPVMSPLLYPQFSILDPSLTFTLPPVQIANGIVDAFVHVLEQYATYPVDAQIQDRMAEGILKTLIEVGPVTLAEPENYDARANLMWSATSALNGYIGVGVPQDWGTHMIGHELTDLFGLDHAQSLAVVLPSLWKLRKDKKRAKLVQYAERVWDIREGSDDEKIDLAIEKTRDFFESLGVKTRLSQYGVEHNQIENVIKALEAHGMTALSETGDQDLNTSREILEDAYAA